MFCIAVCTAYVYTSVWTDSENMYIHMLALVCFAGCGTEILGRSKKTISGWNCSHAVHFSVSCICKDFTATYCNIL